MPYEQVDFDCDVVVCAYHDNGQCNMDCDKDELEANSTDCRYFSTMLKSFSKDFTSDEALKDTMETLSAYGVPCGVLDKNSSHLQSVEFPGGEYGVVQGAVADLAKFKIWKNVVDGGVGFTDKNQLELAL